MKNTGSRQVTLGCIIIALAVSLSSCQYFESEQVKLQKAQALYQSNEFNQAIILTKRILQSDPNSCGARILLGESQFAKFSLVDAQDSLEKAGKLACKDPDIFSVMVKTQLYRNRLPQAKALFSAPQFDYVKDLPETQLLKGDMYFLADDYGQAKAAYAKYFTMSQSEAGECLSQVKLSALKKDYPAVIEQSQQCEKKYAGQKSYDMDQSRYLRAIAQVNQKEASTAVTTLNGILDDYKNLKDPNIRIQSSLLLMNLYLTHNDVDNAVKMANVILNYIAIPAVYHARGLKYEKDNRYDLAEKQFLEALKLDPNYRPSLLELANLKYKEGNIEQARYYTGKVDALTGTNQYTDRLDELQAIKYFQAGDLDAVINKLPHDSNVKSQYILALAYARNGERDKARDVFNKIKQTLNDETRADLLEARLDIELHDFKNAETIFEKYANKGNAYAISGLAQLYLGERKYAQAESLLTGILDKDPKNENATLLLAELYASTNQKQKLFDRLNNAIAKAPDNQNYNLLLAKMYFKFARYQDAIAQAGKIIAQNPGAIQAYVVKTNAYVRLGNINEAENTCRDLLKQDPKSDYAYLMLSALAQKQSHHDKALEYINKALEINPRNMQAVYAKINVLAEQKKHDEALNFARSTANLLDQKQTKDLLLGFVYDKLGDSKNAYRNYRDALADGNRDIRVALNAYQLSKTVNGEAAADSELADFIHQYPDLKNLFVTADYFMHAKNYPQATKYYELFIKRNQKNPVVYNNLAWLKLNDGDTAAAVNYANQALALAPQSAAVMDTMGQVLLKKGDFDKAGSYLLSAYQQLNDNPNVKYHLAQFYYYKNNLDKARPLLQEIVNTPFSEQDDAKRLLTKISH